MITGDQIVAHAIGDYLLQSDWMATKKRTENVAAVAHAATYTLCFAPFLLLSDRTARSVFLAAFVIFYSHFLIDRYGLARYIVWAKNFLAPRWLSVPLDRPGTMERNRPWSECQGTGYPPDRPPFLAVWLLIIADNVLHILINGVALRYL
jgi:hypothetical protein